MEVRSNDSSSSSRSEPARETRVAPGARSAGPLRAQGPEVTEAGGLSTTHDGFGHARRAGDQATIVAPCDDASVPNPSTAFAPRSARQREPNRPIEANTRGEGGDGGLIVRGGQPHAAQACSNLRHRPASTSSSGSFRSPSGIPLRPTTSR